MEESSQQSLIDVIVAFEVTPYLPQGWQAAWLNLQSHPVLVALLLVAAGFLVGRAFKGLIHSVMERLLKNHIPKVDYEVAHYLTAPILQTVVVVSIVLALATLNFAGAVEHLLIQLCFTTLLFLWGRAWFQAARVILQALEEERDRFRMFQPRTIPFFEMVIKLFLVVVFVYLLFLVWDINATAWMASAGIIGIVVGFAARDSLANLIAGISLVADAPYKLGDYIVLDTGERGLVTHLGIRSTRILTRDDIEISIPNAVINASKVINESGGPWVRHRIRIPVGVSYDSDMDKVIQVLEAIGVENETVAENPAPRVRVRGFGDSAINVELLCWIRRPAERGVTVHVLMLEVIRRFREAGIEIPFPQRDVHWRDAVSAERAQRLEMRADTPAASMDADDGSGIKTADCTD